MAKSREINDKAAATNPGAPLAGTNKEANPSSGPKVKPMPKAAPIMAMPRDRLERSIVLTEVQKLDRQQRIRDGIMKEINSKPELKQAYDTLLQSVPENMRDSVMAQVASQARRVINRSQRNTQQTV